MSVNLNSVNSSFASELEQKLKNSLRVYSNFDDHVIDKISNYVAQNSDVFSLSEKTAAVAKHIYRCDSQLPVALNIDEKGSLSIPLNKMLGKGNFRSTMLGLLFQKTHPLVVANSVQEIQNVTTKKLAEQEEVILKKIAQYLNETPSARGLLRYHTSLQYESHHKLVKVFSEVESGYMDDENLSTSDSEDGLKDKNPQTELSIRSSYLDDENSDQMENPKKVSNNNNTVSSDYEASMEAPKKVSNPKILSYNESLQVFKRTIKTNDQENPQPSSYEEMTPCKSNDILKKNVKQVTITEYCNGGNLKNRLSYLSAQEKMLVAEDLLIGLAHLHQLKIYHSDLKPDNIFLKMAVSKEGFATEEIAEAVIGDYGFACDLTNAEDRFFKNGYLSIRAPELQGTFMPGKLIDESILAADVFAMGLIMQKIFANEQPSSNIFKMIDRMLSPKASERATAEEALEMFQSIKKDSKVIQGNKSER